jgi:RNA-directed DNA polymerase
MKVMSPGKLAQVINGRIDRIEDVIRYKDDLYRPFKQHRRGKTRIIDRPVEPLRGLQKRAYHALLRDYRFPSYVHGGVPGKSIFTAVLPHIRQSVVVTIDLRDFYPSISQSAVWDVWKREIGCGRDVARLLADLSTWRGYLPQGAPTSMALANLVMAPADLEIALRLSKLGRSMKYTRWVDDLIVSGPLTDPQVVFDIVASAVRPLGLRVHRKKSKRRIMWRHQRQTALGLGLNDRPTVSRTSRRELRAAVYNYARYRRGSFDNIVGRLEFTKTYHAELGAKLLLSLKKVADKGNKRRSSRAERRKRSLRFL